MFLVTASLLIQRGASSPPTLVHRFNMAFLRFAVFLAVVAVVAAGMILSLFWFHLCVEYLVDRVMPWTSKTLSDFQTSLLLLSLGMLTDELDQLESLVKTMGEELIQADKYTFQAPPVSMCRREPVQLNLFMRSSLASAYAASIRCLEAPPVCVCLSCCQSLPYRLHQPSFSLSLL
jgi:hypothetical protein